MLNSDQKRKIMLLKTHSVKVDMMLSSDENSYNVIEAFVYQKATFRTREQRYYLAASENMSQNATVWYFSSG